MAYLQYVRRSQPCAGVPLLGKSKIVNKYVGLLVSAVKLFCAGAVIVV